MNTSLPPARNTRTAIFVYRGLGRGWCTPKMIWRGVRWRWRATREEETRQQDVVMLDALRRQTLVQIQLRAAFQCDKNRDLW